MMMTDTQPKTELASPSQRERFYKVDNEPFVPSAGMNNYILQSKLPVSQAFKRTCYKCGNLGHHAEDCSSGERLCYNCKKPGHESSKCPNDRSSESKQCYFCKEIGHIQSDCPKYRTLKRTQSQEMFGSGSPGALYHIGQDYNYQTQNFDPYFRLPPLQHPGSFRQDPYYQPSPPLPSQQQVQPQPFQHWVYNHSPPQSHNSLPASHPHHPHYENYGPYIPHHASVPYPYEHINYSSHGPAAPRSFNHLSQFHYQQQQQQHTHHHHHPHQPQQYYFQPRSQFDQYNNLIQLRSHNSDPGNSQIHCYSCGEPGHEVSMNPFPKAYLNLF